MVMETPQRAVPDGMNVRCKLGGGGMGSVHFPGDTSSPR